MVNKESLRRRVVLFFLLSIVVVSIFTITVHSQEIKKDECLFLSGLHYTAHGMSYWYDKAQGGLETVTGIKYNELNCQNCHVSSCDKCHKKTTDQTSFYSRDETKDMAKCLSCHAREGIVRKIDKEDNTPDVHFASGMNCMDCHTAREMHGDGKEYVSMKDPGAMDVNCEKCHDSVTKSVSHTIHGNKMDCKACHVRQVVSCTNCHFETMLKEKKRVSQPIAHWKFLMNYNGKVTSANMQTFVMPDNKTFLIFAPQFSHSIKKDGDKCEDCHAIDNVKDILKNKIDLTWLKDGKINQKKGIIPVADGVTYSTIYQDYQNGNWTPISNPAQPKIQYVGYGTPLTKEQLAKLATPQKSEKK